MMMIVVQGVAEFVAVRKVVISTTDGWAVSLVRIGTTLNVQTWLTISLTVTLRRWSGSVSTVKNRVLTLDR